MSVKLKTASNGSVTLAPEDTASDVTLTVPAGTSSLVSNTTLRTELNATGSAPIFACRAWVNFNGTGTVAIRASGNVSSVTRNSTGNYTVNFTTGMPDANYCATALSGTTGSITRISSDTTSFATGSFTVGTANVAFEVTNSPNVNVAIFR